MFDDYESHLVPKETHSIIVVNDWSHVEGYIGWFFGVSHSYMVHASPGDPSRPDHQEIQEEERAQLDYAEDVLLRCRRIVEVVQADIDICIFPDGSDVRQVLDAIMKETHGILMYQRQHRRTNGIDGRGGRPGRGGRRDVVKHTNNTLI